MLLAVSIVGVLLHVLMDLPTSYGTRLLSPFDWHWFAVDWMPIVDIYLLMALVIGLLGRSTPAQRRAKAAFVLLLMATNYGVRAAAHHQALVLAPRLFGPTLPQPCDPPAASTPIVDSWPRGAAPSDPPPGKRCLVEMIAMPSFTSPFSWRIIAQMSNAYEIKDIDLLDRRYREPDSESEAPWRTDDPVSERLDADGPESVNHASRTGLSRVLPHAGGAIRGRHTRRHHRPLDRHAVCRKLARHGSARVASGAVHRQRPGRRGRTDSRRSAWSRVPRHDPHAAARSAHVGGRRTAARGRARRGSPLRRAADFREEREPVARPRDSTRGDPRVSRQGEGGRASARSSRTPAT